MIIHVVVNPRAGGVRGRRDLAAAIRREFAGHDVRISAWLPRLRGYRPDLIVAAGGDGTVNRLLAACREYETPLGVLPLGTSNDLARALGIPLDFRESCRVIRQGSLRAIDLVAVNDRWFATCGGIGVPAAIAARANRWRRSGGAAAVLRRLLGRGLYLLATLHELCCAWRPIRATIQTAGFRREGAWGAMVFSNQPGFGGFTVSPQASHCDGLLDLCGIPAPRRRLHLLATALRAWRNGLRERPEVARRRSPDLTLLTWEPTAFLGDGEILEVGRRFRIRVVPAALRVAVPQPPDIESCGFEPMAREVCCG